MNDIAQKDATTGAVLVIGGGVAGIQAALDLAESGQKVYLLENAPAIGGVMARLDKTFPTNDCSMCILSPKLVEAGRHLNIELLTCAEVESIDGEPGRFTVRVRRRPRHVDPSKCTGCGLCGKVDVPAPADIVEHDGDLWVQRIAVDQVACVQCGDCVRACREKNAEAPAMSSVHHRQSEAAPGAPPPEQPAAQVLRRIRAAAPADRLAFWQHHMARCMKCYGCRDVCPVFVPAECRLEEWARAGRLPPDAPLYHLARAYYIADRCTHCGFCEETCPSELPLRGLVDLVRHEDPENIFAFVPGLDDGQRERVRAAFVRRPREVATP
jgi:ferredoxin